MGQWVEEEAEETSLNAVILHSLGDYRTKKLLPSSVHGLQGHLGVDVQPGDGRRERMEKVHPLLTT